MEPSASRPRRLDSQLQLAAREAHSLLRTGRPRRRLALGGRRAVAARTWERVVDELLDEHYPAVTGQRAARPAA